MVQFALQKQSREIRKLTQDPLSSVLQRRRRMQATRVQRESAICHPERERKKSACDVYWQRVPQQPAWRKWRQKLHAHK